jgi:hypothetical protein
MPQYCHAMHDFLICFPLQTKQLHMQVVQKAKTVWFIYIKLFYIITTDLKSFSYIIPMKIQALVLCDEFLLCLHSRNLPTVHWSSLWLTSSLIHHPPKTASSTWTSANHLEPCLDCREDGVKKCPRQSASAMCKWSLLSEWLLYILRSRRHSSYRRGSDREGPLVASRLVCEN